MPRPVTVQGVQVLQAGHPVARHEVAAVAVRKVWGGVLPCGVRCCGVTIAVGSGMITMLVVEGCKSRGRRAGGALQQRCADSAGAVIGIASWKRHTISDSPCLAAHAQRHRPHTQGSGHPDHG